MANNLTTAGKLELIENAIAGNWRWCRLYGTAILNNGTDLDWFSNQYAGYTDSLGWKGIQWDATPQGNLTLGNLTDVLEFEVVFTNYTGQGSLGIDEIRIVGIEIYGASSDLPDTNKYYFNAQITDNPIVFEGPGKFTVTDIDISIS